MTDKLVCRYCGQIVFRKIAEYSLDNTPKAQFNSYGEDEVTHDGFYDDFYIRFDITTWRLLQCMACSWPTLVHIHEVENSLIVDSDYDYDPPKHIYGGSYKENILYPSSTLDISSLPKDIQKEYLSAFKHHNIDPNACAVSVGRAIDSICRYETTKDDHLDKRIKKLIMEKKLPSELETMADTVRILRNKGAHAGENTDKLTTEDAKFMLGFLEAILEYLYIAPAKIAAVQARLKKTP